MAPIDPDFLKALACPGCHAALEEREDELFCAGSESECGLVYPVRDGIPVLLVEEARSRTDSPGDTVD